MLGLALLFSLGGLFARERLASDVVPDLAEPQLALVADWMGHPASEVAAAVTGVISEALTGVPGSTSVRGVSMSGMAYIDVVFESKAKLRAGRKAVAERLAMLGPKLPSTVRVELGPSASSTGWVYQYLLADPSHGQSPLALRALQRSRLGPALAAIPGVAEVPSLGGGESQIVVDVRPEELATRGVAYTDVWTTVRAALQTHAIRDPKAIEALSVVLPNGAAVNLGDLAHVRTAHDMPNGLADLGGDYQAVGGIVIVEHDANLRSVMERVHRVIEEQQKALPKGVRLVTVYDRWALATRVENTLLRALLEEIAVVAFVISIFLMHGKSALLPLVTLPLVLLLTFTFMWILAVPATVMSMAGVGIALGMAVDADVVALEACHRRLEADGIDPLVRRARLIAAAASFTPAILTSLLIAALSFTPCSRSGARRGG